MEARNWIVLHTSGVDCVKATSAAQALGKSCVPGGYRHARAVIDAMILLTAQNTQRIPIGAPFFVFVGQPAGSKNP